jgi:hypothetical protein
MDILLITLGIVGGLVLSVLLVMNITRKIYVHSDR